MPMPTAHSQLRDTILSMETHAEKTNARSQGWKTTVILVSKMATKCGSDSDGQPKPFWICCQSANAIPGLKQPTPINIQIAQSSAVCCGPALYLTLMLSLSLLGGHFVFLLLYLRKTSLETKTRTLFYSFYSLSVFDFNLQVSPLSSVQAVCFRQQTSLKVSKKVSEGVP